ncbi:hypothetical protein DESUT3_12550 [Desulfuromonas versatilis]|uniref:Uncharacterized protein n=1 Tax=Desulfuromonas versatilis TaxID=2802975 RepID=A0ABM8HQ37_9BACT|nr:hypothetical protein [Desulfuromonas versatilis]BCR04186.1 hypothetical protein DESUT3_12550 [Desulfuromonas versatilis]
MDQNTLKLFTGQLAHWAEAAIEEGRLPFRKVETFPPLWTEGGIQAPPLVFWINRDSFMAGGVLLVPERQSQEVTDAGCQCARALGLQHFVTWSDREIVFWEDHPQGVVRGKSLALPAAEEASPVIFRESLVRVLEELKLLSVLGAVPPNALSAHFLGNLFKGTLLSAVPYLDEAYRVALGENRLESEAGDAHLLASGKGHLTLLRMLALLLFDRLPAAVQPEGLERAMHFALDTLPEGLRDALSPGRHELPLPAESAVRFHHLFRRLIQLRLGDNRERFRQTLDLLLLHEGPGLGGFPLPEQERPAPAPLLLVNPDRLPGETGQELMVSAPQPLLGYLALLRSTRQEPPLLAQAFSPLTMVTPPEARGIVGALGDETIPPPRQRQALTAQLRNSWPTRRFPLRPQTPRWVWEFIHLLGLGAEGSLFYLRIPAGWLTADFGEPLFELLREEFQLLRIAADQSGSTTLHLVKGPSGAPPCHVDGPGGPRELSAQRLAAGPRSLLPLALELSAELFKLLEDGLLAMPIENGWPKNLDREAFLFSRTTLGRHLWKVVSGGAPLPQRSYLEREALRWGWPLPPREILANLRQFEWRDGEPAPGAAQLDREIAPWIGQEVPVETAAVSRSRKRSQERAQEQPQDDPAGEIAAQVFVDGLPKFPDHYLYDYYRPRMVDFRIAGPLRAGEEFFGRYTLYNEQGNELEVEGAETARALVLCSHGERRGGFSMPAERKVVAEILERYLEDLRQLRRALVRLAHKRVANPRAAAAMVERIWESQPLPPWPLVEE